MPPKFEYFHCVVCSKRTKPKERRTLDGDNNKKIRKYLKNTFLIEIHEGDVVCNKCRQKYYTHQKEEGSAHKRPIVIDENEGDDYLPNLKTRRPSDCSPLNITLPLKSTGKNHSSCFVCKRHGPKLVNVPVKARYEVFLLHFVIIPAGTRCCPVHLLENSQFSQDAHTIIKEKNVGTVGTQFNRSGIVELIKDMREIANKNADKRIDFDRISHMKDVDFVNLTGLTKEQFVNLSSSCTTIRDTKTRSVRTCLGILLTKLRSGMSNKILSTLFNMSKSAVQKAITSARKNLMTNFVPSNLGFEHISRNEIINKHTTVLAQTIFGTIGIDNAIVVLDGTYIYIQKSSNYCFQRRTYSMHKQRPLVKPMLIVSTTGYIVSVFGPYLSDRKNNDANILIHAVKTNTEEIKSWMNEGDIMIVDRGFRDAIEFLNDLGISTEMPVFLNKGQKQHTTSEANSSRLVTKVRWIVESANGRIKQFRYLSNVLPNSQIPFIGDYTRIICAICNKYLPPLACAGNDNDQLLASKMLYLSKSKNELQQKVIDMKLDSRSAAKWSPLNVNEDLTEFPVLSDEELRNLTLGVYQLKQAKCYTNEHIGEKGDYSIDTSLVQSGLLHAKLQSRHTSATKYDLFIEYDTATVKGWYCKCKAGARVVGMCSHLASVIWYLGYGRYQDQPSTRPLFDYIQDAADIPEEVIDESDTDNSESD